MALQDRQGTFVKRFSEVKFSSEYDKNIIWPQKGLRRFVSVVVSRHIKVVGNFISQKKCQNKNFNIFNRFPENPEKQQNIYIPPNYP